MIKGQKKGRKNRQREPISLTITASISYCSPSWRAASSTIRETTAATLGSFLRRGDTTVPIASCTPVVLERVVHSHQSIAQENKRMENYTMTAHSWHWRNHRVPSVVDRVQGRY